MLQSLFDFFFSKSEEFKKEENEIEYNICLIYYEHNNNYILNCIRSICAYQYLELEEKIVTHEEFSTISNKAFYTNFVLEVNGTEIIQGFESIIRFIGKVSKRYQSKNLVDAAQTDYFLELFTTFLKPIQLLNNPENMQIAFSDNQLVKYNKWCINEHIPYYLNFLNDKLTCDEDQDVTWLGNFDSPSVADFCWFHIIEWLKEEGINGAMIEHQSYKNINKFCLYFKSLDLFESENEEVDELETELVEENNEFEYKKTN